MPTIDITPNGIVRFLTGVPLDNSYEHSLYFPDHFSQEDYFSTKIRRTLTRQNYQRHARGVIHVQLTPAELEDCNYLMFNNNTALETKWYYAFVLDVEMISTNGCKVTYEIDVIQTYMFDYQFGDCFIERCHTVSDNLGEHLLDEGLNTGTLIYNRLDVPTTLFKAPYKVITIYGSQASIDPLNNKYECINGNVFNGLSFFVDTPHDAYIRLKTLNDNNDSDAVVAVYMFPSEVPENTFNAKSYFVIGEGAGPSEWVNIGDQYDCVPNTRIPRRTFGNYTPANKKLYSANYFGVAITSSSGDKRLLNLEYFDNPISPGLTLYYSLSGAPTITLAPRNYLGIANNYNEELVCNDFPVCAYATDTFKAWIAQHAGSMAVDTFRAIGNSAVSLAKGDVIGAIAPTWNAVMDNFGQMLDAKALPNTVRGTTGANLNYSRNTVGFLFYRYQVREEYAKIIDDFFTMYGYKVCTLGKPNLNARLHWTYVKTTTCVIDGEMPNFASEKIISIFNNGITFWNDGAKIGKYQQYKYYNTPRGGSTNGQKESDVLGISPAE